MRKGIMVLEGLVDPGLVLDDASLVLAPTETESDFVALNKENEEVGKTIAASQTLDDISDILDEKQPEGLSPSSGAALMRAIEGLCNLPIMGGNKPRLPAFEEFSTKREKIRVSQEAIAEIKKYGAAMLAAIMKAIRAIIAWFKKIFGKQAVAEKQLLLEYKKEVTRFDEVKRDPPVHVHHQTTFTSKHVSMVLSVGNGVPQGNNLISAMTQHGKVIKAIGYAFDFNERAILIGLKNAVRVIHKDGTLFQDAINSTQSEICTVIGGKKARSQDYCGALEPGFALFETPLVFGARTYYRTGIVGAASVTEGDIRAIIKVTDGMTPYDGTEAILALTNDQIDTVLEYIHHRIARVSNIGALRDDATHQLEVLDKEMYRIQNHPSYDARVGRRVKATYHVFNMYLAYRSGADAGLFAYDQKVAKALLKYVARSLDINLQLAHGQ